jgi:hypothetical protein
MIVKFHMTLRLHGSLYFIYKILTEVKINTSISSKLISKLTSSSTATCFLKGRVVNLETSAQERSAQRDAGHS